MMATATFDRPRIILTALILIALGAGSCSNLGPSPSRVAATQPSTGESGIATDQETAPASTATSEVTSTPTATGTPVSSPTPVATATIESSPTPEPSSTTEVVAEITYFESHEEEWAETGFLPDDDMIHEITRNINGQEREFYGYRNGSFQLEFDKEFAEVRYEYKRENVGRKEAGEILMLNPELEDAEQRMERIGYFIHAVNITEKAVEMYGEEGAKERGMYFLRREQTEYDPTWYERYIEFVDNHEGPLVYDLQENLVQDGVITKNTIGSVDAKLPVIYRVLPPVMDREHTRENEIVGGHPQAPFGLSYREFTSGFFDVDVGQNGRLIISESLFLIDGGMMGVGTSPSNAKTVISKVIDEAHGRSENVRFGPGDSPNIIGNDQLSESLFGDYTPDRWVIGTWVWINPGE